MTRRLETRRGGATGGLLVGPLLLSFVGCALTREVMDSASGVRIESRSTVDMRVDPDLVKRGKEWIVTGYVVPLSNTFGYERGHLHASIIDAQGRTQEVALVSYAPQLFRLKGARYAGFSWQPRTLLTSGSTVRLEYALDQHDAHRRQ